MTEARDDDFHTWTKLSGRACTDRTDFTAVAQEDIFAKAIGTITITDRFDLSAEFVVTPGEKTSLEIVGALGDLDSLKDRIMVIECNEQCGLAAPSSAVNFTRQYPVSRFVDLPAQQAAARQRLHAGRRRPPPVVLPRGPGRRVLPGEQHRAGREHVHQAAPVLPQVLRQRAVRGRRLLL